jgi:rhodanese-related sulfurtransferase
MSLSTSCIDDKIDNTQVKLITAAEMQSILELEDVQLVDVRTPKEYDEIRIFGKQKEVCRYENYKNYTNHLFIDMREYTEFSIFKNKIEADKNTPIGFIDTKKYIELSNLVDIGSYYDIRMFGIKNKNYFTPPDRGIIRNHHDPPPPPFKLN